MKFTPEVIAALAVLRDAAENDFERHRLDVLERDLTSPPVVEVIDGKQQRFDGIIYKKRNHDQHYFRQAGIYRDVWQYYNGEIPDGYVIHHVDENPDNNAIENLQCMTQAEHRRLHNENLTRDFKEFTCVVCGKTFTAMNLGINKYCSEHCRQRGGYLARKTELRYCEFCGEPFFTAPTWEQQFCSPHCARKANADQSIANLPKNTKQLKPKTCPACGEIFQPHHAKQICCSRKCAMQIRWQQQREAAKRQCPVCGKEFVPARLQVNQTYCSHHCAMTALWQKRHSQDSAKTE